MRRTMDAFITAVEEARHRLIRKEGQNVSMREIIRRAGYDDSQRAGVAYHLNKNKKWPRGHSVPPDLVARLAQVLPISHDELLQAAQVAAGYNLQVPGGDLPTAYARFLGDEETTEEEKSQVTARILQIIADETARRAGATS
jgi:hypothetical protein